MKSKYYVQYYKIQFKIYERFPHSSKRIGYGRLPVLGYIQEINIKEKMFSNNWTKS